MSGLRYVRLSNSPRIIVVDEDIHAIRNAMLNLTSFPRNNILKFSRYIFQPTLVLVKSKMKNYNSIQILKCEISKYYNSLVFTVYKRLTI